MQCHKKYLYKYINIYFKTIRTKIIYFCHLINKITKNLPKTRSGKIMRRILRKIAENKFSELGDISTLADPDVVEDIIIRQKASNQQ